MRATRGATSVAAAIGRLNAVARRMRTKTPDPSAHLQGTGSAGVEGTCAAGVEGAAQAAANIANETATNKCR